jgi:DNA polymerase-3 subunit epsilon
MQTLAEIMAQIAKMTPEQRVSACGPDIKLITRFVPVKAYSTEPLSPEHRGTGVILDTETTGRDSANDRIIELGMVRFTFNKVTGQPHEVLGTFNALEDPGMPIDPAATRVNGITDDMVKGQRIDDAAVHQFLEGTDIVIAHNASFDREFCERRDPIFKKLAWACSRAQIDWEAEKIGGQKLDYLAFKFGFFYEAHRAEIDCLALLHVLAQSLPVSGETGLKKLLGAYRSRSLRVWAVKSPFETKDLLKARKYRWGNGDNGTQKAWYIDLPAEEFDNEVNWLRSNIYGRPFDLVVDTVDEFSRFSPRRTGTEMMHFAGP